MCCGLTNSMPIEPHRLLTAPANPDQPAWRFTDFAKFVSLFSRAELYLTNVEVLSKEDPQEGLVSVPNYRHREWTSIADLTADERVGLCFRPVSDEEMRVQFENERHTREYWLRRRFYDRRALQISCWHMNDYESAAMWAQYAANSHGIAIKSSYRRIVASLSSSPHQLCAGLVEYLDWNTERVDNSFVFPISKRKSFSHGK